MDIITRELLEQPSLEDLMLLTSFVEELLENQRREQQMNS